MAKLIADHPDYVFTTSTRPWNIKPGDVMPATYIGIWKTLSDNNIPILAMRDTPWLVRNGEPFFPADCLANGGDAVSCGIKRSEVLSDHNPTLDFVAQFPLLKPLDMSDAVCRHGLLPRRGGKRVDLSRLSPLLEHLHAHHDQRARPSDRRRHRLVVGLMSTPEPASVPTVWPGTAYPLGATYDGAGTNFSLFSEVADRVELCLIGKDGTRRPHRPRRGRRLRLALLPADRHPGPALRLPGARPVGPGCGAPLRSEQAAARPVRQVLPRRLRLHPGAVSPTTWTPTTWPPAAHRRWSTRWATP